MRHHSPAVASKQKPCGRSKKAAPSPSFVEGMSSTVTAASHGEGCTSALPPAVRVRLYELFVQIEHEFEALYTENLALQERLDHAESRIAASTSLASHGSFGQTDRPMQMPGNEGQAADEPQIAAVSTVPMTTQKVATTGKAMYAHKLRSHTNRLRAQTNRLVANLKGQGLNCTAVRRYSGHKDGIWEVSVSRSVLSF